MKPLLKKLKGKPHNSLRFRFSGLNLQGLKQFLEILGSTFVNFDNVVCFSEE